MCEDYIGGFPVQAVVLPAADGRDVRGEAGVDSDVVFSRVRLDTQAAEDEEAVASVELAGEAAEFWMEGRKGKGLDGGVAEGEVEF